MKALLKHKVFFFISFILLYIQATNEAYASHAQSADITYQCLGGNNYRLNLSFYRDCAGVAAPNTATINLSSFTCAQNFTATLNQIPGTGIEVSPICASMRENKNRTSQNIIEKSGLVPGVGLELFKNTQFYCHLRLFPLFLNENLRCTEGMIFLTNLNLRSNKYFPISRCIGI